MICSKCGTELRKDSVFCHKCGTRVAELPPEMIKEAAGVPAEEINKAAGTELSDAEYDEYFKLDDEEPGKKKGIIIGIAVAAAAICLICFCCSNTFKRTFYKPADYYKYVEKKNAKETIGLVTGWYDAGNLLIPGGGSIGFEDSLSLKMSEDILRDTSEALDVYGIMDEDQDLSWLQEINISGKTTMYDELSVRNTSIAIGSDTVLTLNTIEDQAADKMYLRIPELSDKFVGIDESGLKELSGLVEKYTDTPVPSAAGMYDYLSMSKSLPEAYKLNKILTKYTDIFFNNMNHVSKSGKQKLEIGGVDQKCWCLTVDMDYKDMKNLAKQLREELSEDKDVRDAYIGIMEAEGKNGEENWNDLIDDLYVTEDILGALGGSQMKVYVDSCGNIIAREITPTDFDMTVRYGRTVNGRTFGAQFVVNIDGDDFVALRGSGKKAGKNYAGDFKLSVNDAGPIGITLDSFDYGAFKKQKLDARATVGISDIAGAFDLGDNALGFIEDYNAVISVGTPGTGAYAANIKLSDGMSEPVVIDYSYKKTGGSRISVPEDPIMIEGLGDLKTYVEDADFDRVRNNLQNAGVPSALTKYITYIEKAADYLDYIDLFL